jgi:mRNA interferase MazF
MVIKRFEVHLVNLHPTLGSKIAKTRPCLVISPDEMHKHIATVTVAPLTSQGRNYPSRVSCKFVGIPGQIVLDQIRTVDKSRLVKLLGKISPSEQKQVLAVLMEMFTLRHSLTRSLKMNTNLDPIHAWLIQPDAANPSVRYFALRDPLDRAEDDAELRQARARIMSGGPVAAIRQPCTQTATEWLPARDIRQNTRAAGSQPES